MGFYIIIVFLIIKIFLIIGFLANSKNLNRMLAFFISMVFELALELGKTLLLTGIIGLYFIPEEKDFTKTIYVGIILFILGYYVKYIKENK